MEDETLEKVIVELYKHWSGSGAERMWAKPLGDDLFELQNIPFYSYEVNFGDIVHAVSDVPEHWPTMDRVVTTSGNQTVRVIFKDATEEQKKRLLSFLFLYFRTHYNTVTYPKYHCNTYLFSLSKHPLNAYLLC